MTTPAAHAGVRPKPRAAIRRTASRPAAAGAGTRRVVRAALLVPACAALMAGCQRQIDPTNFVDPFIGTGAHGHTYPGATVPFGMVQLSPDNGRSGWDWCSGYNWADSIITGFSHTHLSGTGIGDLADVLFMPTSRRPDLSWEPAPGDTTYPRPPWASRFSHDRERASPGYYSVVLDGPNVRAELTATEHAGVHRYTWLAPDAAAPGLVIDLGFAINWDRPTDTALRILNDTMVAGHRFSTGWAKDEKVFFVARLSRPITAHEIVDPADTAGAHTRAYLQFAPGGAPLVVRVGLSYVDEDGALRNLEAETGPSFDQLRGQARAAWRRALGGVEARGGDDAALRTFYTALYHTKLAPIVFQDVDGRYRGADGEVHKADGFTNYSIFSLWDTFRAEHPLLTILEPGRVGSMVQSMLAFRDQSGWLPVWSLVGNETNTMTGYHAVPVIADAILKGIGGFNQDEALSAMVDFGERDWRGLDLYRKYGYVPSDSANESVTRTLEYAYDDWAVAQAARRLGQHDDYVVHMRRSTFWMNVFDAGTRFARGKNADGTWVTPFDPVHSARGEEHTDYTEGNAWQHTWFVPQDPRGLIDENGWRRAVHRQAGLAVHAGHDAHRRQDPAGHLGPHRPVRPRQRAQPPHRVPLRLRRRAVEDAARGAPHHGHVIQRQARRAAGQRGLRPDLGLVRVQRHGLLPGEPGGWGLRPGQPALRRHHGERGRRPHVPGGGEGGGGGEAVHPERHPERQAAGPELDHSR